MDLVKYDTAIRVWVVASLVVGVGFIALQDPVLTTVGVVLVVLGLLSLMAVVRNALAVPEDREADRA
jgi:F0F1-type ATP synthase assembly protein I